MLCLLCTILIARKDSMCSSNSKIQSPRCSPNGPNSLNGRKSGEQSHGCSHRLAFNVAIIANASNSNALSGHVLPTKAPIARQPRLESCEDFAFCQFAKPRCRQYGYAEAYCQRDATGSVVSLIFVRMSRCLSCKSMRAPLSIHFS